MAKLIMVCYYTACRKRRIKCGEQRPSCQNCIKSKRQCEGYNQRVVFKDPLNAYRPSISGRNGASQPNITQIPLQIAPKLGRLVPSSQALETATTIGLLSVISPSVQQQPYAFQSGLKDNALIGGIPPQPLQSIEVKFDTVDHSYLPDPISRPHTQEHAAHYDFDVFKQERRGKFKRPTQTSPHEPSAGSNSTPQRPPFQNSLQNSRQQFTASAPYYPSFPSNAASKGPKAGGSTSSDPPFPAQAQEGLSLPTKLGIEQGGNGAYNTSPLDYQAQHRLEARFTQPTVWPAQAEDSATQSFMNDDDKDPFDIPIDDDDADLMDDYDETLDNHLKNNDLGNAVALRAGQKIQPQQYRSFASFINQPDMLATYVPSPQASPLSDSMVARIFCHFVHVTASCISLFERHPANPSLTFQGLPVPQSQQHIWACKLYTNMS